MTIWYVMKTHVSSGKYYQVLPYNLNVLRTLLYMEHGLRAVFKFIKNSRLTEKAAHELASKKNNRKTLE